MDTNSIIEINGKKLTHEEGVVLTSALVYTFSELARMDQTETIKRDRKTIMALLSAITGR